MQAHHPTSSTNWPYHAYVDAHELASRIDQASATMVALRHDLHAHPELSFAEHRTTAVIRDRLIELGWNVAPSPTDTGAIATLAGPRPGRRVMLRADIDALPVAEERDLTYRSVHEGVMHACGHDVHTAALLGVAEVLAGWPDLAGSFTLVFQPAEEGLGGARAMVEGGVLDRHPADAVIGGHVTSLFPVGLVATRPGVVMSRATAFRVDLQGRGGHGALAGVEGNVVLAVAHLVTHLSEVVDGLESDGARCACSAGVVQAGTANNVVPSTALIRGTLRTFTQANYDLAMGRLTGLIASLESTFAVRGTLTLTEGSPAVVNDPDVTAAVSQAARAIVGDLFIDAMPPTSASDDVSEFLNRIPGCYFFVGGALPDGSSGSHHGPDFAVDDDAVRVMAHVLSASALALAAP